MKYFLFFFAFLFFTAQILAQDATQTAAAWQVTKYEANATLPTAPTDRNLNVKATISLKNVGRGVGSTATFRINPKAEVAATRVGAATASSRKTVDDKAGSLQRFTVSLPVAVQPGETVAVAIDYRLPIAENTGLNAISPVGSQFLPLSVWIPTPNNPYSPRGADFAPFSLTVNAPNGETVVSSGAASGSSFEQRLHGQPFFLTGNWDVVNNTGETSVYLPKGAGADERKRADELVALINEAKNFITTLLGDAPAIPIRLVAVTRGAGFSDAGTILLDYAAFRRQKIDSATAMQIAEAVAKIRLGNATPIRGDGYGAIREGLSQFVATQFIEKQFGKNSAEIERLRQRTAFALVAGRSAPLSQTSPLDETYFTTAANKGSMIWRLAAKTLGESNFFNVVRSQLAGKQTDGLNLANVRDSLSANNEDVKTILDFGLNQTTDTDLLIGLPQARGAETVVALRNAGSLPVTVSVLALTERSERLTKTVSISAKSFGEAVFNTNAKFNRVEVDAEKFYPQINYSNDTAPKTLAENDPQAEISRAFNRLEYAKAEAAARQVLSVYPNFDDARVWLGRSLLEQNKLDEAEKEFAAALNETLPTPKTQAWANIGLGEIAQRRSQLPQAAKFFDLAVKANAEYASNLTARNGRLKAEASAKAAVPIDENARTYFANFDKTVVGGRKTEIENLIVAGELSRFSSGLTANSPEQWQTQILRTENLDANRMVVEVSLNAKIINREAQTGTSLFVLARTANGWKLAGVDLFEVR
jgi:tetratricopeptide (TPR) repeat protein